MKIQNHGKVHDLAQCRNCSWCYTAIDGHKRKNIYYHIKKHIEETGHSVHRETGSSINYKP